MPLRLHVGKGHRCPSNPGHKAKLTCAPWNRAVRLPSLLIPQGPFPCRALQELPALTGVTVPRAGPGLGPGLVPGCSRAGPGLLAFRERPRLSL